MSHVDPVIRKGFIVLKSFHQAKVFVGVRKKHVQAIKAAFAPVANLGREFKILGFMNDSIQPFPP